MSNLENVLAFQSVLKANKALREQYEGALNRIAENKEASCDGEAMVKAAAEAGYTLTIPEAERFMAEYQTLDDEALQMVVGGDCPWCGVGCFLTSSPNDRSAGGSCWTDYNCLILFLESAID